MLSATSVSQMTLSEGYRKCTELAQSHYENFPVGRLVPKSIRPHVHAVYAFARVSDDIADEGYTDPRSGVPADSQLPQEKRLQQLRDFRKELDKALALRKKDSEKEEKEPLDPAYEWIFLPLIDTKEKFDLPESLFYDLLSAFEQDIVKRRYADFEEVLDYCVRSANPIGRLVLFLHQYRDPKLHQWSDHICTALQLANFWQDVSVDLGKDRIYLPQEDQKKYGFDEELLFKGNASQAFRDCLKLQVDRAQALFDQGKCLPRHLSPKLSWEIRLTWLGGATILKKIREQNYDTLSQRPKITPFDILYLLPYAWITRSC